MPTFHIQRYELCASTFEVEADSEAEAIATLIGGHGQATFRSHQYIEIAENCGLPTEDHRQLAEELRLLGVPVREIIPSIRSVNRFE